MPTNNAWNSRNPAQVAKGGTGRAAVDAYTVVCGGISDTDALQNVAGTGTLGQVLTSNGPASLPSWSNSPTTPASTTLFSAAVSFPYPIPPNVTTVGNIGAIYLDPGSNVYGNVYNVPSDGIYFFNYNLEVTGDYIYNYNCMFHLAITYVGQIYPNFESQFNVSPARMATDSAVGEPAGKAVGNASFVNISLTTGATVTAGIVVESAGVSCSGVISGYRLY
jgi:hypothetical protein